MIKKKVNELLNDEQGFSLIEIIVAVILLGTCFMLLATLIHQNSLAIQLNKRKEEAAFVRDDLKEWLSYKGQMQDLVNLNNYVFIKTTKTLSEDEKARRNHFILDDTGIQVESGLNKYGEMKPVIDGKRGPFLPKVKYYQDEATFLPEKLRTATNQLYIGEYRNRSNKATDFLIKVESLWTPTVPTSTDYNPRKDGIDLKIMVYDKKTGTLLTETVMNWVAES